MFLRILLFFFSSRRRHTRWNCDWSSDVCSSDLEFCGFAMQVDAECKDARPVGSFELRGKGRENSRQDIAGAAFREAGIAGGVDKDLTVGGGDDGVRALEDDVSVPAARGVKRFLDAILLHVFC